jgi:ribosomal protein S6--L-glutamate ligase
MDEKIIIGNQEWCSFPELGIPAIKARVDSGARTSAIHAINVHDFRKGNEKWVSFEVHPIQDNRRIVIRCEAPLSDRRVVKSTSGFGEKRFVIRTRLKLGGIEKSIELTLANRDSMGFRMLLGREAMGHSMLVDPASEFMVGSFSPEDLEEFYGGAQRQIEGLNIGLLASDQNLYSNRRILEAGEERGHNIQFLNIRHCYMKLDANKPEVHYRGGKILDNMDAVIPRIRPSLTFYGCALTRQFENTGAYTLNSASSITQSRDKLYALQMLLNSELDIPITGFANSPYDTHDLIEMVGGAPLIVKLLAGAQGKGVVLAETRKAAESVINAFKSIKTNLLVQEFIKEANGKDLRCFVVDGRVVAAIERTAAPGEFRANLHQGGSASVVKLTSEEKKLALRAAKVFNLVVAGVDIIRSKKGPLLLEVNSSPGLEGVEMATGKDIAGTMIAAIERKLDWKTNLGINFASENPDSD